MKKITGKRRPRGEDRHEPLDAVKLEAVAALFRALAEPSRLSVLQVLQSGPASVGELVDRTGLKQANVSKQLGILTTAGLVARQQAGNRVIYSIAMPLVFKLCDMVCRSMAKQAADRAAALLK